MVLVVWIKTSNNEEAGGTANAYQTVEQAMQSLFLV